METPDQLGEDALYRQSPKKIRKEYVAREYEKYIKRTKLIGRRIDGQVSLEDIFLRILNKMRVKIEK